MNLHALVSQVISSVNPFTSAIWLQSTGYTTDAAGNQTPSYVTSAIQVQNQALSAQDLRHLDMLNISNVTRKVWANGSLQSVNRATRQGGDLLQFGSKTWLVEVVFETWDQDGPWCSVGLAEQDDPTS